MNPQALLACTTMTNKLDDCALLTSPGLDANDEQFIQSLGVDYLYELLNFVPGYQSHRTTDAPIL